LIAVIISMLSYSYLITTQPINVHIYISHVALEFSRAFYFKKEHFIAESALENKKDNISFKHYILYRNRFNEIQRLCKQNYYAEVALYQIF